MKDKRLDAWKKYGSQTEDKEITDIRRMKSSPVLTGGVERNKQYMMQ